MLEQLAEDRDYQHNGRVFADALGRLIDPNQVGKVWRRDVARPLGLEGIRVHDLRHAHASALLAMGVNTKIVTERLGHHSTAFAQDVYGHVMPTMQSDAAEAFSAEGNVDRDTSVGAVVGYTVGHRFNRKKRGRDRYDLARPLRGALLRCYWSTKQ